VERAGERARGDDDTKSARRRDDDDALTPMR
jgi:hypothetical protein